MNRFSLRSRLLVGRAMGGEVIAGGAAISAVAAWGAGGGATASSAVGATNGALPK